MLYDTIPVYASERCVPFSDVEYNGKAPGGENMFFKFGVPNIITQELKKQYPRRRLFALKEFLEDNDIYDLHSGNWGYDKNGKLKIIDYSNYYEDF